MMARSDPKRDFAGELRAELGAEVVLDDPRVLERYRENVSGLARDIPLVLRPRSAAEVQTIVLAANRHCQPLSPLSRGKNWGLGSKLPAADGCAIVDLSRMDRILKVDEDFGYAVIEPGVTQAELATHLLETKSRYFLDVTGAGRRTSIVGNALERGMAFNSLRVEQLLGLELVLGDGELLKTGFAHYPRSEELSPLFRYGIGPGLDSLFVQSNFGIVTAATIELMRIQESHVTFVLSVEDEGRLGALVETLRELKQQRVLSGVGRIGNRRRSLITLAPLLYQHFKARGKRLTRDQVEQKLDLRGAWTAVGTLAGTSESVALSQRALTRALRGFGRLRFVSRHRLRAMKRLFSMVCLDDQRAMIDVMETLFGLNQGVPTDAALHSLHWPRALDDPRFDEPDQGSAGLLFCAPMIPMKKSAVDAALAILRDVGTRERFEIAATFNMVHDKALETVLSIDFDRTVTEERARALRCVRILIERFVERGYYPYRIDVEHMPMLIDPQDPFWRAAARIKDALDPAHVIAPRKFNLS